MLEEIVIGALKAAPQSALLFFALVYVMRRGEALLEQQRAAHVKELDRILELHSGSMEDLATAIRDRNVEVNRILSAYDRALGQIIDRMLFYKEKGGQG